MIGISETLEMLLVRQGLTTRERLAGQARGMGDDGARDSECAQPHHQTAGKGGDKPTDGNLGKGPAVNAPAKFTGLHVVSDNSRNWRTQTPRVAPLGVRQFLVLERS